MGWITIPGKVRMQVSTLCVRARVPKTNLSGGHLPKIDQVEREDGYQPPADG